MLWIRDTARQEGIEDLIFLARDGELPLKLARAMPPDHWSGMNLDYLHCGRQSWSLAGAGAVGVEPWISLGTADEQAFLIHSSDWIPFATTLKRCGLAVSDLPKDSKLSKRPADQPLDRAALKEWAGLLRSGRLNALIEERALEAKDLATDFLRQIDLPSGRLGLVDVGWRGQQAWLVGSVIAEVSGTPPVHLHFGGHQVNQSVADKVDIRRFALDDSVEPQPISSPVACLEMFLASGAPRLLRYVRTDAGHVEQIFGEPEAIPGTSIRDRLCEGALAVARQFPSQRELAAWGIDDSQMVTEVRELLKEFWNHPTAESVSFYADLMFEVDDSGDHFGSIVSPYRVSEVFGEKKLNRMWSEGSLAITNEPFRTLFGTYLAGKRLIR